MSCLSDEPFLLHFNTAADLDENRVPATCHACLKNVSHCSSTPQLTSMKTVCQLPVIFTISSTTLQLASISTVSQLHVIFTISSTTLQLASITTVSQLHVIFPISSTTRQLASITTVSQLHVLFTNSSTTLQLTSMKTVCQIHVMLRNSSRNTAAGLKWKHCTVMPPLGICFFCTTSSHAPVEKC